MANRWAAFVFHVGQKPSRPAPRGLLLYYDSAARKYFRATEMTMLVVEGNQATIHGEGRENGGPVVPFHVIVADGRPDTFQILWQGYEANGLVRGYIKIDNECDRNYRNDHDDHDDQR